MNIVKVSSSGQITLPKNFRNQFDTNIFTYVIEDNRCSFIPVDITTLPTKNTQDPKTVTAKAKYSIKDLPKAMFHSKNKKITNLSEQVDQIVYNK